MISVVMPAHNEEGYLQPAVASAASGLRERQRPFEILVVENGSRDRTLADAEALAERYPEVRVLHRSVADYGAALREGFEAARGEVVVNFDVDLVDLGFLDRALAALDDGEVALVVGSKRGPGADDSRAVARRVVTAGFSALLRYGFGLRVTDTHGLKALRRGPLAPLVAVCRFGGDIFDTELVLRAERAGLRTAEVPVAVREVRAPRTPISRRIPRALLGLVRLRIALWRHR